MEASYQSISPETRFLVLQKVPGAVAYERIGIDHCSTSGWDDWPRVKGQQNAGNWLQCPPFEGFEIKLIRISAI